MSKPTTIAILAALAVPAYANDTCAEWSEFAETAAEVRYSGMPMREAMEYADGVEIAQAVIQDAYSLPSYSTKEFQQEAVVEFGNDVYTWCLDSMRD